MTDVVLIRQAVDPGKVRRLKEWTSELRTRTDETVETLRDEGVYTESAFLERTDDGPFLVTYVEAEDVDRAMTAFAESTHDIDATHREVLDDVLEDGETVGEFEPLYHVSNPDR